MIDIELGKSNSNNYFMEKKGSEPFPLTTQQSFVSNRVDDYEFRKKPDSYNKD